MRKEWAFPRVELDVSTLLVIRRDIHNPLCLAESGLDSIIQLFCESDFPSYYASI
jgi:hypothetical protein